MASLRLSTSVPNKLHLLGGGELPSPGGAGGADAAAAASPAVAAAAAAGGRPRGEVFCDGYVDVHVEGAGWFGSARWVRRYAVQQASMIHLYASERDFLDGRTEALQRHARAQRSGSKVALN